LLANLARAPLRLDADDLPNRPGLDQAGVGPKSILEAGSAIGACLHSHGAVVRASFSESAVAPAMGSMLDVENIFWESFVGEGRDVHFLGPNVLANVIGLHTK